MLFLVLLPPFPQPGLTISSEGPAPLPTTTDPVLAKPTLNPVATSTTTSPSPRWTFSPYVPPGTRPTLPTNSTGDGTGVNILTDISSDAPILSIRGPLNALAFILCLMVIPAFIVWCCMRRRCRAYNPATSM
ncbi:MAG: hypothetical protein J3R72DRAFT_485317 [Linnemannia gamsii]|nr:MAG: hypothetical protein J3R72DRAFT_485317 [Linnemannia gamsii]